METQNPIPCDRYDALRAVERGEKAERRCNSGWWAPVSVDTESTMACGRCEYRRYPAAPVAVLRGLP